MTQVEGDMGGLSMAGQINMNELTTPSMTSRYAWDLPAQGKKAGEEHSLQNQ